LSPEPGQALGGDIPAGNLVRGAPTSATLLPISILQWRNAVCCRTVWRSQCQAVLFWLSKSIWNSSALRCTVVFLVCERFWRFRLLSLSALHAAGLWTQLSSIWI